MSKETKPKICFVIAPLGADAVISESDEVLKYVISPRQG